MEHRATPDLLAGVVRPARRPAGWTPGGPPPAGPGDDPALHPGPGEDLCYLTGDWRIFQLMSGHRWSLDDLATAWFALDDLEPSRVRRFLDLGCGIGSVLMMTAWRLPHAEGRGIEAQEVSFGLCQRSLRYNGCGERVQVHHGDLRDPALLEGEAPFDLITGTPPYIPVGDGTMSERPQKGPCCFETRGGIEAYCATAARHLHDDGRFVACEGAGQEERVEAAARESGLFVHRRLDVIGRAGKAPLFAVYRMGRQERPLVVEQLVVRGPGGERPERCQQMRAAMGLPP